MGDREFNTKSDRPMGVEVRTEIRRVQNRIEGRVFLDARENRSDWTRAAGWSEWTQLYSAPPGRQITQFQAPAPFRTTLRISRHGPHNCSSGGVVALCTVWGDRGGSEAGSWTRVQIDWAEFAVQVRETQPAWL